ncbi:MAG: helix-hairpin-helix domain-containing protein [Thermoleophilaceae bacterium]
MLTDLPNVGPKVAAKLEAIGIAAPEDLQGRDGEQLYEQLCALNGRRHDPCLLDTFVAAVAYADGGPPLPWWHFSRRRKAREQARR